MSDDHVKLSSLVKYLRACQQALETEGEPDSALRFELLVDYLSNEYSPKDGLSFKTKHLGL